jgi:hypothetical protein
MRLFFVATALTLSFGHHAVAEAIKIEKSEIKSAVVEIPKSPDGETAVVVVRVEIKNISKEAMKLDSGSFKYQLQKQGNKPEVHPHFGLRYPDKKAVVEIKPGKVETLDVELAAKKIAVEKNVEYKVEIAGHGEKKEIVLRFKE